MLVEAMAPKRAPTLLVNRNRNAPPANVLGSMSRGRVGVAAPISSSAPVLGVPFTNTVAIAQPRGNALTGSDLKKFVDQLVDCSVMVRSLSKLRNFTTGLSDGESLSVPYEAVETPRKRLPVRTKLLPGTTGEV